MRTASFPWDQLRSTFLHEMSASPVPGFPPLSTNFWPVVLHRIEMRIVFFTFFPLLSLFFLLSIFFFFREWIWILISLNGFYENIFFPKSYLGSKSLNYFELLFFEFGFYELITFIIWKNRYITDKEWIFRFEGFI